MTETTLRFNLNRLTNRGKENFGFLLHFNVNNFHWDLNFRGDAPLMKYMTNGEMHILQIDGDVFHSVSTIMCDPKIVDDNGIDSYIFSIDEGLRFINILLYEDLELENEDDNDDDENGEYTISYFGENEKAFKLLNAKIQKCEQILADDIAHL